MKASATTIRNILEGTKQFQIPLFQRPYSWKKENWQTLWEDLMNLYNNVGTKGSYFLGSIVTQPVPGTAEGISPFLVIDGQQRLTTLTIILAALRNYLNKSEPEMAQEIEELYLINKFKKEDNFYKILPTQDDCEVYKSIIKAKLVKDFKKEGQIYEAYKYFAGKLKKPDSEADSQLEITKFKNILLECLVLVNITTDETDNPYLIFESLNNKGEELTQADLVRNYIFMKLRSDNNLSVKSQEEIYHTEWLPLQEDFKKLSEKKGYADELTNAFWFYLRKDGEAVNQKEVYKTIKNRFDESKDGIQSELQNLVRFARYYQRLNFYNKEQDLRLRRWFKRLIRLDFTTCHIFLLNIYRDYEENSINFDDFEKILMYLESYFVRRWLAGVSTKVLGTVFNNLYNQVQESNSHDLVSGLRVVLSSFEGSQRWPDDDSFRSGIIHKSLYSKNGSSNDRIKLFLESIEAFLTKELVSFEIVTIEHIMPQSLNLQWQNMLGNNYRDVRKKWLHTLSNLTLTGYNSELSNHCFEYKQERLNDSNLSLNQYFRYLDYWNAEKIEERGEYLADIAVKIWSR